MIFGKAEAAVVFGKCTKKKRINYEKTQVTLEDLELRNRLKFYNVA